MSNSHSTVVGIKTLFIDRHRLGLVSLSLCCVLLSACAPSPVPGAYPAKTPGYVQGAAVGTVTGTAIAGMTGSSLSLGAVVGFFLGGAIGSYQDVKGAINQLASEGIQVIQLGDIVEVVIPSDLIFDPENADILRQADPLLNQVVALLRQYPNVNIAVSGHSDDIGSTQEQYRWSSVRSQAILAYVWSHGIPIERLSFYTVGSNSPDATFNTANGLSYNRRTVITFWRKAPPGPLNAFKVTDPNCWTGPSPDDCVGGD